MGAFNTKELLSGAPTLIPEIANKIAEHFRNQEYEVAIDVLSSGGREVSISKGGLFKAVLGMKTALKISLLPQGNAINFDASVGIFGKQVIPTLIMWYVAWPVILTQIWGLIQQSKLDDEALEIAKNVISEQSQTFTSTNGIAAFCSNCGTKISPSAKFCSNCGKQL